MIKKLKSYIMAALVTMTFSVPMLVPVAATAAVDTCNSISQNISAGAAQAANGPDTGCGSQDVNGSAIGNIARSAVTIFSTIVGAIAIIMIIYGGFRYITSGGDSNRVGSAKNTLIYAIIGLIIVALAQVIVHFVLNQSTAITTS